MLTLYYKPTCPYCLKVLAAADELGVKFDLKNIVANAELRDQLIALGGKKQVPFLVDTQNGVSMYESDDIIAHIEKQGKSSRGTTGIVRVHKSGGTENICK